jgi:hypothetical protein
MGYKVTSQQVTAGTNVKTTISAAYTSNTNLLYVLLVGDWAEIKSDVTSSESAPMDPMLGCVAGSDNFPDIFIGRFSAGSTTDVTTQVNKTINYEKTPTVDGTWYKANLGIASDISGGDDSETDKGHIGNIWTGRLSKFTYTTNNTAYDPGATAAMVSTAVNSGVSLINYCGHGDWNVFVTSGFSNSNVSSLTNGEKLPIIFSVACINGEFHTQTCFAEYWQRKTGGGAIASMMSTILMDWVEPMVGQDYICDLITGGYTYANNTTNPGTGTNTDHGKTHLGSVFYNGEILMYSEMTSSLGTLQTWTLFGDPSLQIRTDTPKDIILSNSTVTTSPFTTTVTVGGIAFANAMVSIWDGTNQPTSALTNSSGQVTITHGLTEGATAKLTVTGFNLMTIAQDITIQSAVNIAEQLDQSIKVYPNPASENFTLSIINSINGKYQINIIDMLGNTVISENIDKNDVIYSKQINLSNVAKGSYILKYTANDNVGYMKIIVE